MGKFWSRAGKTKEEIISDIEKINKITNSELFYKKTTYLINFQTNYNFFNKLLRNLMIHCEINVKREQGQIKIKEVTLKLPQFYKFFNALMDCLPIFYKENVIERRTITTNGDENEICPICEEKQHFFCEKCIHTWLFNKKNNCPLCRFDVNLKNYDGVNIKKHQWNLIELDVNEYMKECNSIFQNALAELMNY